MSWPQGTNMLPLKERLSREETVLELPEATSQAYMPLEPHVACLGCDSSSWGFPGSDMT